MALGPKPRKYDQKTPKKMISLALRSALSDRAGEGKVVVVDSWGWETPSTKAAVKALAGLGIEGRVLVVVGRDDAATALSFRNVPEVQLIAPGELNAYDVLCNDWILFTQDVLPTFEGKAKKSATQSQDASDDEADAARGGSAADDEPAIDEGSGADDEPAIENDQADASDGEAEPAEGSASDEADAARGGSAADDEPAIENDEPAIENDEATESDDPS